MAAAGAAYAAGVTSPAGTAVINNKGRPISLNARGETGMSGAALTPRVSDSSAPTGSHRDGRQTISGDTRTSPDEGVGDDSAVQLRKFSNMAVQVR